MTMLLHTDVLENGLSVLSGASLSVVLCQTRPTTRTEAATTVTGGGKRISEISAITATLQQGANAHSRQILLPETNTAAVESVGAGSADLWVAVYDGTRLLAISDTVQNTEVTASGAIRIPEWQINFAQPAMT